MDSRIVMLAKFGKEEYMKSLQRGELYCKRLYYYSELEKNTGDRKIGDKNEGKHIMNQCNLLLYDNETGNYLKKYSGVKVEVEINKIKNMPVFCMVGIKASDLELLEDNKDTKKYKMNIEELFKDFKDDEEWESALIINNHLEFFERINKLCAKKGIVAKRKSINYTDMSINLIDRDLDVEKDIYNIAFWKDNFYKNQFEYRIIFENIEIEDYIKLNIGDISDISQLIKKDQIRDFFKGEYMVKLNRKIIKV